MNCSKRFCVLVALATLISCGASQGRSEKLREAVYYFNEGVRWGRVQDVLSRLDPEAESHFLDMHKDFGKNIQITDYEITSSRIDLDKGTAEIGLKIIWYRLDAMVVHETLLIQHWKEKDRNWVMAGEEFVQGEPF